MTDNKILKKEKLADLIWRYRIHSPKIASKRKAGQFIILRVEEDGERIPLTIANAEEKEGWIEIIFQVVGYTTCKLSSLKEGENILDLAGPLGKPMHIEKFGKCLCIGGGVGVAPLYPIACALKNFGNEITTIIGARNKNLLILEDEMKSLSDHFFISTDDGSKGYCGYVSDVFKKLKDEENKFDFAMVIGPALMMKVTTELTVKSQIKTYASLNPIMIDGTGMCGCCRVTVSNQTKFACVDGPEFDASKIDWDELIMRLGSYKEFEKKEVLKCQCKLNNNSSIISEAT